VRVLSLKACCVPRELTRAITMADITNAFRETAGDSDEISAPDVERLISQVFQDTLSDESLDKIIEMTDGKRKGGGGGCGCVCVCVCVLLSFSPACLSPPTPFSLGLNSVDLNQFIRIVSAVLHQTTRWGKLKTEIGGRVGFSTIGNQIYSKAVKRGFEFNILVVGERETGGGRGRRVGR
jgi:hypothetical protein